MRSRSRGIANNGDAAAADQLTMRIGYKQKTKPKEKEKEKFQKIYQILSDFDSFDRHENK